MGHHKIRQQFIDRGVALDRKPLVLSSALLAQMLLDLFAVANFGQVHRRRLIAVVAFEHRFVVAAR
jgi:hypothetical protein